MFAVDNRSAVKYVACVDIILDSFTFLVILIEASIVTRSLHSNLHSSTDNIAVQILSYVWVSSVINVCCLFVHLWAARRLLSAALNERNFLETFRHYRDSTTVFLTILIIVGVLGGRLFGLYAFLAIRVVFYCAVNWLLSSFNIARDRDCEMVAQKDQTDESDNNISTDTEY